MKSRADAQHRAASARERDDGLALAALESAAHHDRVATPTVRHDHGPVAERGYQARPWRDRGVAPAQAAETQPHHGWSPAVRS